MKSNCNGVRILLVDDNLDFLRAMTALLEPNERYLVVGCAVSGREAIEMSAELQPDAVLLDIDMPGGSGLDLIARIRRAAPLALTVVVSAYVEQEYAAMAVRNGADAFVAKTRVMEDLLPLLDAMAERGAA